MIPGDLLSAFPHRRFHTLPGLLDSWAALPNSNPNACMPMQGGSLYHFYDGLWYDPAERWTHDLPCERRTRYRLSQPDTVRTEQLWHAYTSIRLHNVWVTRKWTSRDKGIPHVRLAFTVRKIETSLIYLTLVVFEEMQ